MPQIYAFKMAWVAFASSISFLVDAILNGVTRTMTDRHAKHFGQRLLEVTQTRLEVFHADRLDPTRSYLYMSNHQSMIDIPVMFVAVPHSLRMVAKEILFKVPFFGSAMRQAGIIPIDRKNIHRAKGQLEEAKERLKEGLSIWLAPEGTRSRTLELLPFKKGGFHVALALGVPILPVWIQGAGEVMHADSLKVFPGKTVQVYFGNPVETVLTGLPVLMEQVRKSILELEKSR